MPTHSYKGLIVWQKAVDFTVEIYRLTECFPQDERFGIVAQMRRASVSIASNLAEGSKRTSRKEYRNFVLMSFGSGAEIETQLIIAERLKLAEKAEISDANSHLQDIMRLLNALQKSLL
jgi:four helix bundle protein